jgi:hypothetical protein
MTDLERSELFMVLSELSRRYPHWRVGQLVANVAGWADAEVWDVEDGQLLSAARAHLTTSSEIQSPDPIETDQVYGKKLT